MIVAVDGFNLIYKFPDLEELMVRGQLEPAMQGLVAVLARMRKKYPSYEVHIFFDGRRSRGDETFRDYVQGIHCYYSIDESADYLIKEFVESKMGRVQIRVVSSDKQVRQAAKAHGCEVQTSEEFREWYGKVTAALKAEEPEKPAGGLSEREVADWMQVFRKRKT